MVRWLGHGQAQQLGPVCDPANRETVAEAIRRALHATLPRHDIFLCEEVPASQGWPRLLGGPLLLEAENPTLRIEAPDWELFLASRSANFREQVRRRERTLGRRYNLRFRLCDDGGRLQDDLTSLFGLHRARWRESGIDGFRGYREPLHRDFAARALERGWLRLWILELDGRSAAAWYGFRFGGADWYYQAGRDPALERDAVGFVLMAHTVREAIRDGMREYRLLRGGQEYKYRFANADDTLQTVGLAGSLAGRAALIGGTLARRMPPGIKEAIVRVATR
jgi:CelD/BcsL family acetyltransferase involved in cellulose biosynthesis